MECLGKKRKGVDISVACEKEEALLLTLVRSHFSLEDYSRRRKKCKEVVVKDDAVIRKSVVTGVVTAPPCGSEHSNTPGRGLKRKIGCLDAATRLGRKKKIDQDYELGEIIGKGKFGIRDFACKTLRKGEESVHREVEIMQHLSGYQGVVTLKAVYEDAEYFHLVMELCSGGRLLDQMAKFGPYSEQRAANVIKELMLVIRYCHEMGVVHRDIKPENVLLTTSGQVKLADFGLAARISDGQSLTGIAGSPAYVAPEVLLGHYTEKVDIWSAGVTLYALLCGLLPFHGNSLESVFNAIKKENLTFCGEVWKSVSQPARDLISRMLTRDASARYSADEEPCEVNKDQLIAVHGSESERNSLTANRSFNDDSVSTPPSGKLLEGEESSLVDVLAMAISRVKISEPKRSRLCSPARQIEQECTSNIKVNHLCTAF
nr:serine/threonine-protein kinase PEPKR2-like [Ipomoea batatas]